MKTLSNIIERNRKEGGGGIYAVCCAHPTVIEAALLQGIHDKCHVLIEATANQVNQFGGYTGMLPKDFVTFVQAIAEDISFPFENIIFGGDHLGPTCWVNETSSEAMEKSKKLIESYVAAGFKKIHLDTSMECADDSGPLSDEIVAQRAALLCKVAEDTAVSKFGCSDLVYVVGTEVPPPGGAKEDICDLEVTPVRNVRDTIKAHERAFFSLELQDAWQRVVAVVVQPGVEFDNFSVIPYESEKAQALKEYIETVPNLVYEAHSTDYQPDAAYQQLVKDHFAILKVGPQLTYALREALYALSYIEEELIATDKQSKLRFVCESEMQNNPSAWNKFYPIETNNGSLYRQYSFSDRIRYYWNTQSVKKSVDKLYENLSSVDIPISLISQFMPNQYTEIVNNRLSPSPESLVNHRIMQVTSVYSQACNSAQ
jgi:D-tagatose-1,6-bisphosphate aldolase subunit GatZ/KbaZ